MNTIVQLWLSTPYTDSIPSNSWPYDPQPLMLSGE